MRAYSILPTRFEDDRHGCIERGAQAAGYELVHIRHTINPNSIRKEDILLTWTRFRGHKDATCQMFEKAGARPIICEEAYYRRVNDKKCFAMAIGQHAGCGFWQQGDWGRWNTFNIPLEPFSKIGKHILVTEQRGIGSPMTGSPPGFHENIYRKLKNVTDRPIVIRYHPKTRVNQGLAAAQPTLDEQLVGCWCVVTWNSAAGIHAVQKGIPAIFMAPYSVIDPVVGHDLSYINNPCRDENLRLQAFERLSWAMWNVEEIESGEAFSHLLRRQA